MKHAAVQEAGSARRRYTRLMDGAGLAILEHVQERARRGHPVARPAPRPLECPGCGSDITHGSIAPRLCGHCAQRTCKECRQYGRVRDPSCSHVR